MANILTRSTGHRLLSSATGNSRNSRSYQSPDLPIRKSAIRNFLNRDLPSDHHDAIARQPEEIADVDGVSLHHDIQGFLPFGHSSSIVARDDRAVADVVDHITKVEGVVLQAGLFEHGRNIRLFHKAEPRRSTPIIWLYFFHEKALRILDPRYRLGNGIHDEQIFLQSPIVFDMPDHHRWGIVRGS